MTTMSWTTLTAEVSLGPEWAGVRTEPAESPAAGGPTAPARTPGVTQDDSQCGRRGPEDTPPQQLHLHTRNRHLEGEETQGVAGQLPQHLGGRRAVQAHQPRASSTGHWQGQPGGRVTDGGTAGRGWDQAPQGAEPLHPRSPPGSPLELGLLQKGATCTGTRAAAHHSSKAGRGEGGSGDKGAWGPGVRRPHPHSTHRHQRGHEGLLHPDTEHPPTNRCEGCYSSSVHFTGDETEALESETGHLVKLQSGFKPQSIWALSPIHIP